MLSDILQENPAEPLAVFVVWFAVLGPDSASSVDPSLLDDVRAVHFWDSNGAVSETFAEHAREVGLPDFGPLWDAYLLFEDNAEWTDTPPPVVGWGTPVISVIDDLAAELSDLWMDQ